MVTRSRAHEEQDDKVCYIMAKEPSSIEAALDEECWKYAMDAELDSIESNGTWELATFSIGQRDIGIKWVFKVK